MSATQRGQLVTIEGGEGSGKTTLQGGLERLARGGGREVVTCREPGGTHLGERLREALLGSGAEAPDNVAELLVFTAARAQLVAELIRPALDRGALVICDRYVDSTVAYQHHGRGIERADVDAANAVATGGLMPDLTVLLDLPPYEGLRRVGRVGDYLEREPLDFHRRVRAGYLAEAEHDPGRWLVLDAVQPPDALAGAAWERIAALPAA